MTAPIAAGRRKEFEFLRSVCRTLQERSTLGTAIRQGWSASGIEAEARIYKGKGDLKYRIAIQDASERRYYSPEERAADEARWKANEEVMAARAAIAVTHATKPKVPPEYKPVLAACRNMLDIDRLSAVLEAGWLADDIRYLARQFCWVATRHRVTMKETPAAIRFALEMIEGKPAGKLSPYLPRPNQ
ncbi:hypothetical protein JQ616_33825 [Bradyrhizobium tropiciagri]|uniref:hypothetical protein n=1 Tax=Bradyrhizobium tropiciagri TaxID=312253 RepID=UPI001BAD8041|nr:hypothetical protein [Bradyrhizobium tropiciagri]MBR0899958.1 hypothetical protein [Bradyrhizobium tropiciagri]